MASIFRTSLRSPFYLLKRLQLKAIKKYGERLNGSCLDLGCGDSFYRPFLKCDNYIGFERKHLGQVSVIGVGEHLPFGSETFDSLLATEVLEHIADFQSCLSEINRILKTKGVLYVTVPMTWPHHYEPNDYYRFTRFGIQEVLERHNFRIIRIERFGGPFASIGSMVAIMLFDLSDCLFSKFGKINAERIGTIIVLPVNIIFLFLGILDRFYEKIALGWAVIAEKI